ncbi:hypothetical protein L6164_003362 [Bauhinia variegata]|uniref:Uncharacterized protein n=1 Tax=Bauhinia variegata TaxID=167791 RepID=A0ACB9Q086_BAUVA|nr:hypothetical protein L6164_003362 [Bauhinia variegata]
MEKLKRVVNEIAYTRSPSKLSPLHRSLIPFLSFASSLYKFALSLRRSLYHLGFFATHRLSVPVISVGNLTWGGNGKTPMVEFIALRLADSGVSPLIISRGYQGGDEAILSKDMAMLIAEKNSWIEKPFLDGKVQSHFDSEKIGVVVLDDAMQYQWRIWRDLEIVMVNGLTLWGNRQLMPLGPLREPLVALRRADIVVVHQADLVWFQNIFSMISSQ